MTLSPWDFLSVLLVPVLLGMALLRWQGIAARTDPLAYAGWAWIQGSLALGLALSAWSWLGWPLRASWLVPPLVGVALVLYALARRVPLVAAPPRTRHPAWERLLFALALAGLLLSTADRMLLAANEVLATSDEARIWAAKAKVIFHTGGFGAGFRAAMESVELVQHADYPPLNPLLQVWVHAHAGSIVHVESRLPIQVFALVLVLVAASAARRRARPLVAALFLLGVATLGRLYTYNAFSDGMIALGVLVAWDLWQRFQEDGERGWLRLLASSSLLLVWSKNEGFLQVLVFALGWLVAWRAGRVRCLARHELRRCLAGMVPLLLSVAYLSWFNAHFGLENDLVQSSLRVAAVESGPDEGALAPVLERASQSARPILASFARLLLNPELTRGFLLAFLVLLLAFPRTAFARERLTFTLGILLALLGYMAVYLGTRWELEEHLAHSAHRLVSHLTPAAGLWLLLFAVEALPMLRARQASPGEPR